MNGREPIRAVVDAEGRVVLPPGVAARLGLVPGASVMLDEEPNSIRVRRPVGQLAKVYIEPTSRCNLACRTCIRNAWEEPLGDMSAGVFARVLEGMAAFDPRPSVFFGGFGEPLAHPRIYEMVRQAKSIGAPKVELITNGCLLTKENSRRLVEGGLDTLWVSLDGIHPESYSDVRLGALLPEVLENIRSFGEARCSLGGATEFGIAFVAMKRNIADLPDVLSAGLRLGATRFNVSNVLPYTEELLPQLLYQDAFRLSPLPTLWHDFLRVPVMDITETTRGPLSLVVHGPYEGSLSGTDISGITRYCPFVESGSTTVTWDGAVSPCQALTHSHTEYMGGGHRREVERYLVGNLADRTLESLWLDPEYVDFRTRVQRFEFAPCISCGGCNLSARNEEDCEGDEFPRCGACLWSHGLIRCP
jgi:MoaA/NifB/PqqE/SkfB family radical SAM enzyme